MNEAWNNLPENIANRFPTVTHMRKIGLIECGYYNERMIVLPDHESAKNVATFVGDDQYAVISVVGPAVVMRTAMSQSRLAMGQQQFRKSKEDVLTWAAELCGITYEELTANVGTIA